MGEQKPKDYQKILADMHFKRNSGDWKDYERAKFILIKQPFDPDYEAKIQAIVDYFAV